MNKNTKYLIIGSALALLLLLPKRTGKSGIAANNPLNLRRTNITWKGKSKINQGAFEVFDTYTNGLRAGILNALSLYKAGKNTIYKLIATWAPAGDGNNNPSSYANYVSTQSAINQNTVFSFTKETMYRIIKAMEQIENGYIVINESKFNAAWKAAGLN